MRKERKLVFVVFALAILFSMVREWYAPVACSRPTLAREFPSPR
jgi:hypothetical protein